MTTPVILEQVFNAPIEKVWHVLTDTGKMKEWYFPALLKFEPVVGYKFEFTDDGSSYKKEWIVTKVVNGKKLAHSWSYKGYLGNSEVVFELFEEDNQTRLILTHTGLESFPNDSHFARHRFEDGWKRIIGSNLKDALEKE